MALDHEAIYLAYKDKVFSIDDSLGCFDKDGKLISVNDAKVKEARATLNAQEAASLYQRQRTGEAGTTDTIYPSIGDQLDNLYKDILAGTLTSSGTFAKAIEAVKAKYPKP